MTDQITKTDEPSALAKDVPLSEQVRQQQEARRQHADQHIQFATDGSDAARENATGSQLAVSATNPAPLATIPEKEKRAHEMRLTHAARGPTPPGVDEMHYRCISCGWDGTLQFDPNDPEDAEILAEVGDIQNFAGPCPGQGCGYKTLVPHDAIFHETLQEQSEAQIRANASVVADAVIDRLIERGGDVLMGAAAEAGRVAGIDVPEDEGAPVGELEAGSDSPDGSA